MSYLRCPFPVLIWGKKKSAVNTNTLGAAGHHCTEPLSAVGGKGTLSWGREVLCAVIWSFVHSLWVWLVSPLLASLRSISITPYLIYCLYIFLSFWLSDRLPHYSSTTRLRMLHTAMNLLSGLVHWFGSAGANDARGLSNRRLKERPSFMMQIFILHLWLFLLCHGKFILDLPIEILL